MFLNIQSVASKLPGCHSASLSHPGQDQVEARASDVMAGAGGAAGPAQDVRHQQPGDANEERAQNVLCIHNQRKMKHRRVDACSAMVMPAEKYAQDYRFESSSYA